MKPKKPAKDDRIALTVKISQRDYERLSLLRAKTRRTAMEMCEEAIQKMLHDAGV